MWDAVSGQELLNLTNFNEKAFYAPVSSVIWSPDGKRLKSTSETGMVRTYVMDLADLLNLARSGITRDLTPDECQQFFQSKTCPPLP